MEKLVLNENELAQRWGISSKTLQRWRSEGRGPRFLKLSKRVIYPLDEIQHFESNALYESTWQKASDVILASDAKWLTPRQLATVMGLPMYTLTHPNVRKTLGIPHTKVGKLIRFNPEEVMAWARKWSEEAQANGATLSEDENRRTLLLTLAQLPG
ncbi:helix-turn-helix domain-containing protein [Sheuella amnicola]|uniref:helix-turn-helix domain-containing protein n=1 Tax=Sheuella amnicola TaxID=2707330 RepID=UPI001F3FD395|nr:helix-turn-helix domain-containing protein [Sheuella amnicola]